MTNKNIVDIRQQLEVLLSELEARVAFKPNQLLVIGCSTSEVVGEVIGTSGAFNVAEELFIPLHEFVGKHKLFLAFQGCEHINRAITLEREAAKYYHLEEVSVVPVKTAGGSMSAYAYTKFQDPVVVEHIRAHAGIDIGQTLIGMHLKEVVVPVRTSIRQIGEAIVTVATTRPKLIGGERAVYSL